MPPSWEPLRKGTEQSCQFSAGGVTHLLGQASRVSVPERKGRGWAWLHVLPCLSGRVSVWEGGLQTRTQVPVGVTGRVRVPSRNRCQRCRLGKWLASLCLSFLICDMGMEGSPFSKWFK